jgi:hypothetical protein
MTDFLASSQSGTEMKRSADAGTSPVPECSVTEKMNAGMPIPAASTWMPMPSYDRHQRKIFM